MAIGRLCETEANEGPEAPGMETGREGEKDGLAVGSAAVESAVQGHAGGQEDAAVRK